MKNGRATLIRTLVASAILLALCMSASAAVLDCNAITALSQLIAQGSCQFQDKIFSNFSYTDFGTADPLANVLTHYEFTSSGVNGTTDIHGWGFTLSTGSWTNDFNLSYNIAVDVNPADPLCTTTGPGVNCSAPNQRIFLVKDQINSGQNPNTSQMNDIETVTNPAGQVFTLNTNGTATPPASNETGQAVFSPIAISINTDSTLLLGGGQLTSYEQQWFEKSNTAVVPEPATFSLMGLGLLSAGFFGRKRLKR
jgi:PEP-CTERM motif